MTRRQAFQHLLTDRFFPNAIQKILHDFEIHVRFKQRETDFLQRFGNILLREHTLPTKLLEDPFKFFA